ncbi:hypothetical protein GQ42DRAFT_72171 [Ramicandelaber brevisporus]|nr:hypothetical protein GQ42DRAFT_72171 [Ramicandelaber brevisporus]
MYVCVCICVLSTNTLKEALACLPLLLSPSVVHYLHNIRTSFIHTNLPSIMKFTFGASVILFAAAHLAMVASEDKEVCYNQAKYDELKKTFGNCKDGIDCREHCDTTIKCTFKDMKIIKDNKIDHKAFREKLEKFFLKKETADKVFKELEDKMKKDKLHDKPTHVIMNEYANAAGEYCTDTKNFHTYPDCDMECKPAGGK